MFKEGIEPREGVVIGGRLMLSETGCRNCEAVQRPRRSRERDRDDDRHPWMIHENINEAFMMLGPFLLVSTREHD
jgi:hypothetical protein